MSIVQKIKAAWASHMEEFKRQEQQGVSPAHSGHFRDLREWMEKKIEESNESDDRICERLDEVIRLLRLIYSQLGGIDL